MAFKIALRFYEIDPWQFDLSGGAGILVVSSLVAVWPDMAIYLNTWSHCLVVQIEESDQIEAFYTNYEKIYKIMALQIK